MQTIDELFSTFKMNDRSNAVFSRCLRPKAAVYRLCSQRFTKGNFGNIGHWCSDVVHLNISVVCCCQAFIIGPCVKPIHRTNQYIGIIYGTNHNSQTVKMANRTVKDAKSIRGTNPQYLVEKILRSRIYDSKYWKEECFALTAELLVDKAMELRYVGGVHGGFIYPTPFLCLVLKMLQIQPEKDIVVEFIKNEEFKYVRALGAFYMRLTGSSLDCYKYLEPLYNDNRKLRRQNREGQFEIVHMDEFIDELLREERLCDVILPRIQKRHILEENNELDPKVSALDDDLDEDVASDEDNVDAETKENKRDKDRRDRDRKRDRLIFI